MKALQFYMTKKKKDRMLYLKIYLKKKKKKRKQGNMISIVIC